MEQFWTYTISEREGDEIVSVYFDTTSGRDYRRLARVFAKSVRVNMPEADLQLIEMRPPKETLTVRHWSNNSYKLEEWVRRAYPITENTIVCDCDMLVLGDLSTAFENDFDVAETWRTNSDTPVNGGMIFLKPTPGAHNWFKAFLKADRLMRSNRALHGIFREKYTGQNQAAMGYVREKGGKFKLIQLPCRIYNACNDDWPDIGSHTKAIHIKGELRKSIFGELPLSPEWEKAYNLFLEWENKKI